MRPPAAVVELAEDAIPLVGVAEIVKAHGISRRRVFDLRLKPSFPKPVAALSIGPVWRQEAVDAWFAARAEGRRPDA